MLSTSLAETLPVIGVSSLPLALPLAATGASFEPSMIKVTTVAPALPAVSLTGTVNAAVG